LLENNAHVNVVGFYGSALTSAIEGGNCEVCRMLLDHGADVSHRIRSGDNALQLATRSGHEEIVGLLIERGVDVNEEGFIRIHFPPCGGKKACYFEKKGKNALEIAIFRGHKQIEELLRKHGAKPGGNLPIPDQKYKKVYLK
jgi:ankyrin repeat protein